MVARADYGMIRLLPKHMRGMAAGYEDNLSAGRMQSLAQLEGPPPISQV